MTFTSVTQANSNTAEFARLFDLFDRVATQRARAVTGDNNEVISADDIANVPAEFAPVLKNLSTILSLRAGRAQTKSRHSTSIGACSATPTANNTTPPVDVIGPPDKVEAENEKPCFPPGQRYPFTFKLMLHKLYDLDEWAEKVESAVEASKSQFKPLAERVQDVVGDSSTPLTASVKEQGENRGGSHVRAILGTSAKFKPPSATRHTRSGLTGSSRDATANIKEEESSIRPVLGSSAKFKPPRPSATPVQSEASRVLKKRCIGRRKSINGPMATGVWVYDAAISAIEVAGPQPAVEITLSAPRGHGAGGMVRSRARHRSLTAVEGMHSRDIARRKIRITVSLSQDERGEFFPPQAASTTFGVPVQAVTETGGVIKGRSVTSSFAPESRKKAAVKRSLCV